MMCEEGQKSWGRRRSHVPCININSNSNSSRRPTPTAASTVFTCGPEEENHQYVAANVQRWRIGTRGVHIWTERQRRKKMRTMFSSLLSLFPHLPPKADKSTIVDEAIKCINTLQINLQQLQKQMLNKSATIIDLDTPLSSKRTPQEQVNDGPSSQEFVANQLGPPNMPQLFSLPVGPPVSQTCFLTWFSPNVVINMCGKDAQISVCCTRKPWVLATIFYILDKYKIEVVFAHICSNHYRSMYMIHAHVSGAPDRFSERFSVEETFQLAAGEVIFCLLSY
ncbi:hypothetical protein LguiA_006637 [Lonicera macranthoides]